MPLARSTSFQGVVRSLWLVVRSPWFVVRSCSLAVVVWALTLLSGVSAQSEMYEGFSAGGLHYVAEGHGPVVVLIHAFHMDLREWDDVAPELTGSRRIVRYDVRGHGSSRVAGPLPSPSADLSTLLDELRIDGATLVGSSMGATIALELALTAPTRVERLILVAPGVPGVEQGASPAWLSPIMSVVRAGDPSRAAELWWDSPLFEALRARPDAAARIRRVVADNARIWGLSRAPGLTPPAGSRLEEVAVPVTVIAGDRDQFGSQDVGRIVAGRVRAGEMVVLEGAGHMIALERPRQLSEIILRSMSPR